MQNATLSCVISVLLSVRTNSPIAQRIFGRFYIPLPQKSFDPILDNGPPYRAGNHTHLDKPYSVELHWTSGNPYAETST